MITKLLIATSLITALGLLFVMPNVEAKCVDTFNATGQNETTTKCSGSNPTMPPTIGISLDNFKRVEDGFCYNQQCVDAQDYFTPFPKIVTQVGKENLVTVKVWDNEGLHYINHVGVAFGLGTNQHFSQSVAQIDFDLKNNQVTYSEKYITDVRVLNVEASCCENVFADKCRLLKIWHTFKEAPEFDIVAVNTWNEERAYRQFLFNDGVDIQGPQKPIITIEEIKPQVQIQDPDNRNSLAFKAKMKYEAQRAMEAYYGH